MKIGVVFPQTEIGADPGGIRAYAQAAQDLGYDHLMAFDHVVGADRAHYTDWSGPYDLDTMFHEVFVLFGFIAAVAPRLELVTDILILPQRQAVLVAKQAAEVDVLTGGRFRLGVGIGWNPVEYEALGENFKNRGLRLVEQIQLLRELFTRPSVTFEGRFHKVTAAGLNPMPVQRPIPIWIGANVEVAMRRAAFLADGFFPMNPLEGGWEVTVEKIKGWLREAGRDPATFGMERLIQASQGGPGDWLREVERWKAFGATHMAVNTMGGGLSGVDAHIERLREVRQVLA